jgi:hypothetical protein
MDLVLILLILGNGSRRPPAQNSSTSSARQSTDSIETEPPDASDELLDNLVRNATLTATKDAIRQRRAAGKTERQSCMF